MRYLVTGGAGFIGSNFVKLVCKQHEVAVIDKLTYAGNPKNIINESGINKENFHCVDIQDSESISNIILEFKPNAIINFAAESHVDRSIKNPDEFIDSNILGTYTLLKASYMYWSRLSKEEKNEFRFLHVSTDEVYGTLSPQAPPFNEDNQYSPNSPYSASKAASDHLVRAWHHTYGLPVLTTNCSNNYGPYHFPEKLIPLIITNALAGKNLPIYGDGLQVRDWLYVKDHCSAIRRVLEDGRPGETYNIGGWNEKTNLEIVHTICSLLDEISPRTDKVSYKSQITHVTDRPGHDRRYAIDARKIERELGWRPAETFETGIRKTVQWYLDNPEWVKDVQSGAYRDWMNKQYGMAES